MVDEPPEGDWKARVALGNTDPKSAAGKRTIGITDLTVWALRAQRRQQATDRLKHGWANDDNLVFTTERGGPLHRRVVWDAFKERARRAGARPIRYHDPRHACATLMMTGGEELAVISMVLGHADYSTTLRVYAHLDPDRARVAAARIDEALHRSIPLGDAVGY